MKFLADINESELKFDLIIIGSGIAGISFLKRYLTKYPEKNIALLESGGEHYSFQHQLLNTESEISGSYYPLAATRVRQLGGTSNHWTGLTGRSSIAVVPIKKFNESANYYYKLADDFLDVKTADNTQVNGVSSFVWKRSKPTRVAEKYKEIINASNVTLFLDATVVYLNADNNSVKSVIAKSISGNKVLFKAKNFVLATGGIEIPRLLLHSKFDKRGVEGIGKRFCEHPHIHLGRLFAKGTQLKRLKELFYVSEKEISGIQFSNSQGYSAGITLQKVTYRNNEKNIALNIKKLKNTFKTFNFTKQDLFTVGDILNGINQYWKFARRIIFKSHMYDIRVMLNQEPKDSNKVTLGNKLDSLGVPLPNVTWELSDKDINFIYQLGLILGKNFFENSLGVIRFSFTHKSDIVTGVDVIGGFHHMGTTAVGKEKSYAVDTDLKLKTTNNLTILGSSLFNNQDFVNPSLTIAALGFYAADNM